MIKNILTTTALGALVFTGVAAQAATANSTHPTQVAQATAGSTADNTSGKSVHLSGTVVDLLSFVRGTGRSVADTGNTNNGNNANGNNNNMNSGGNNNANNGGGNNANNGGGGGGGSSSNGLEIERPLAIVANGHAYMIDLPSSQKNLERQLAGSLGRTVTVSGRVYQRDGESVIVVDSMA